MLLSASLIIYNLTLIDFGKPFGKDSIVSAITILAGLCSMLILAILLTSQKIKSTLKESRKR